MSEKKEEQEEKDTVNEVPNAPLKPDAVNSGKSYLVVKAASASASVTQYLAGTHEEERPKKDGGTRTVEVPDWTKNPAEAIGGDWLAVNEKVAKLSVPTQNKVVIAHPHAILNSQFAAKASKKLFGFIAPPSKKKTAKKKAATKKAAKKSDKPAPKKGKK